MLTLEVSLQETTDRLPEYPMFEEAANCGFQGDPWRLADTRATTLSPIVSSTTPVPGCRDGPSRPQSCAEVAHTAVPPSSRKRFKPPDPWTIGNGWGV